MRPILVAIVLLLAGCAVPPTVAVVDQTVEGADIQRVFVATNRTYADQHFTGARDDALTYGQFDVSIPPDRQIGQVTWPDGPRADPQTDFVVTSAQLYSGARGFQAGIHNALMALPEADREVVVFVHGYYSTFASGLFRAAQLAHDYQTPGLTAHFSWPSAGRAVGYVYDRESASYSRDALETFLQDLTQAGARRILLVGHSLGAGLVMETLRQARMSGDTEILNALSGVALISPDIDIDVFRTQAQAVEPLPQPFVVFTSSEDRALRLSAGLSGSQNRLGSLGTPEDVADFDITLVDISAFHGGAGDWTNHLTAASSPDLIRMFQALSPTATGQESAPFTALDGTILTVRNATRILLLPTAQ